MQMEMEACCQLETNLHQPHSSGLDEERCADLARLLVELAPHGSAGLLELLRREAGVE
jgi:hypothetical protein